MRPGGRYAVVGVCAGLGVRVCAGLGVRADASHGILEYIGTVLLPDGDPPNRRVSRLQLLRDLRFGHILGKEELGEEEFVFLCAPGYGPSEPSTTENQREP